MNLHVHRSIFLLIGFKRYGSQKSRKVSSQSQFSDRGLEEDVGLDDTESLLSEENEGGDHEEPNDVSLCHNMPWIKVRVTSEKGLRIKHVTSIKDRLSPDKIRKSTRPRN